MQSLYDGVVWYVICELTLSLQESEDPYAFV